MRVACLGISSSWGNSSRVNRCAGATSLTIMPAIGSLETSLDYLGATTGWTDRHTGYDESGETADEFIEELFSDHFTQIRDL